MNVTTVERLDLRFDPKRWAFADERRGEIDALFAQKQRVNPRLWNGSVLMLHRFEIADDVLRGAFLKTDYASLNSWLGWDRPDAGVCDCFGVAAVMGSDGAFLLGEMAPHTANAGRIYFPCGTPDLDDIKNDVVDFDSSIARELLEETGLNAGELEPERRWTIVQERGRVVAFRVFHSRESGEALRQRVGAHIEGDPEGELAAVHLVRGPADITAAVPKYAEAFLRFCWP